MFTAAATSATFDLSHLPTHACSTFRYDQSGEWWVLPLVCSEQASDQRHCQPWYSFNFLFDQHNLHPNLGPQRANRLALTGRILGSFVVRSLKPLLT
jgi:hypothetical protein